MVKEILGQRPHLAVALNSNPQKDSDRCLREAIVQLRVAGLPLKNPDPYPWEQKIPEATKNKLLTVRLNGSNYLSPKTKQAFEKALQSGHRINVAHPPLQQTTNVVVPESVNVHPNQSVLNANGHKATEDTCQINILPACEQVAVITNGHKSVEPSEQLMTSSQQTFDELQLQSSPELLILDSLEYALIQFNRHQHDILRVHKQSLKHQIEYTRTFFQLMQQQNSLLESSKLSAQPTETKQIALSYSERSMMRFHEHNAETLRVHEQYLNHQTQQTKNFFQLLEQQYELLVASVTEKRSAVSLVQKPPASVNHAASAAADAVEKNFEVVSNSSGSNNAKSITSLPAVIDEATLSQTLLKVVSEKTGYPVEMLELSMDIEADLGIDSIKRVEILGALLELYPDLPKPNPEELGQLRTLGEIVGYMRTVVSEIAAVEETASVKTPQVVEETKEIASDSVVTAEPILSVDFATLSQTLLKVVSEKTGYPVEMLELSMDIEADLGIDSIKRVEILGALLELYPDLPKPNPEELGQLRTLGQIVDYMKQQADTLEKNISASILQTA